MNAKTDDRPDESADEATDAKEAPKLDLLQLVRDERPRAIGFEQDATLLGDRTRALNYFKGDVTQDIPALPNRSSATSSDISDAIDTLIPDLIEIFIGGDDVVALKPQKETDEDAAEQETAYLHHVAFQENPGFLNIHTALQDACLEKTGIFHWEWKEEINEDVEDFTGKNAIELQMASQDGEVSNVKAEQEGTDLRTGDQTYSFRITKTKDNSQAKYWAIRPEDFAASEDTVYIQDTTYCCERQRPRVQDLIADGFDPDKVRALESYSAPDRTTEQARDTAGESDQSGGMGDDTSSDLRQVEIHKHCIRVLGPENKLELWCIYTNSDESEELYREQINAIPYAVGSPYLVAHRLIGRSVADLLIEIMKLKTAFLRMVADSGYFALNQRMEVAMDQANTFTLSDLLRNEPMVPVRSKNGQAVRPLQVGGLGFDAYKALEYLSTVAESRTGVVRNAQGLNPDTLHDTAKGAMMLLSAAQKRTRMIARVLAETLLKPLFLGLHACIRENCKSTRIAQLQGKWVQVDPTKWAERNAMTVEVGLGAAGKDAEIAAITSIAEDVKAIVEVQGGAQGPIVTLENVYNLAKDKAKKLGVRSPEEYFTDPNSPEGQQAIQAMANKPNPEMAKIQGEQQLQASKQQGEMQIAQTKVQAEQLIQNNKSQMQAAADQHKQELEHQREMQKHADEMQLEALKIASAERIAIAVAKINAQAKISSAQVAAKASDGSAELAHENQGA